MKKDITATQAIFVDSRRSHIHNDNGPYYYEISYCGNYIGNVMTAEEVRTLIACLQQALKANGEGGAQ